MISKPDSHSKPYSVMSATTFDTACFFDSSIIRNWFIFYTIKFILWFLSVFLVRKLGPANRKSRLITDCNEIKRENGIKIITFFLHGLIPQQRCDAFDPRVSDRRVEVLQLVRLQVSLLVPDRELVLVMLLRCDPQVIHGNIVLVYVVLHSRLLENIKLYV